MRIKIALLEIGALLAFCYLWSVMSDWAMALPATSHQEELSVEWVGCPMVSNDDPWSPTTGWLPQYEIGFRSDGVVVWRKKALPPKPALATNGIFPTNSLHITNVWNAVTNESGTWWWSEK